MQLADAILQSHPDLEGDLVQDAVEGAAGILQTEALKPRAMVEWQSDPVGWAEKFLGIPANTLRWSLNPGYEDHQWDGDPDPISTMLECVSRGEDVGVESGTGTGKSFGLAVAVLWFLACFDNARVNTYAPKEAQLTMFSWAEIAELFPAFRQHFPTARLTHLRIQMYGTDKWAAFGIATAVGSGEKSATKAQGAHAENMLLIVEEGPGVQQAVYTALENTRTDDFNIQIVVGNPDARSDPLHQWCELPWVTAIRASALDHPNVVSAPGIIPGAVSTAKIERRKVLYADRPELYDSRVRGISPEYKPGLALKWRRHHLLEFGKPELRVLHDQGWEFYGGIDFGAWRFAFVLGAVDRAGRVWILEEYFSGFGVSLRERAQDIHELLGSLGVTDDRLTFVGDVANQTDIIEINRAWAAMEAPWRVRGVSMAGKARVTAVERLNDLLAMRRLAFRRDLGTPLVLADAKTGKREKMAWRKGANVAYQGDEQEGSRLLWEISEWSFPEAKEGKAQIQDPDDDTADGADAIAALRYLVMTWLEPAGFEIPDTPPDPNRDTGLEELAERRKAEYRAALRAAS